MSCGLFSRLTRGNRFRGMLYGMTARMPWDSDKFKADPRPVWKLWDDFGIADARTFEAKLQKAG